MNNELEIVKWAAGSNKDISYMDSIQEDTLMHLITQHRLSNRLNLRTNSGNHSWLSPRLKDQIHNVFSEDYAQTLKFIEVAKEIFREVGDKPKPLVIKGFTDYLISGDKTLQRRSSDIDIIYNNVDFMRETLESLGFTREGAATDGHEEGNYFRDDVIIDLHRYFPVAEYPKDIGELLDADESIEYLKQNNLNYNWTHIYYDDLIQDSINYNDELMLVNMHVSVLVSCCHIFRSYTKFGTKYMCVKLAELASIRDMVENPSFEIDNFDRIIIKYNARDSVEFVCYLMDRYFGTLPKNFEAYCRSNNKPLLNRNYLGLWGYFEEDYELITPHNAKLEFNRIFSKMISNSVDANHRKMSPILYSYVNRSDSELKGIIVNSNENVQAFKLPFSLDVQYDESKVYFHLTIPEVPKSGFSHHLVRLYFRSPAKTSTISNTSINNIDNIVTDSYEIKYSFFLEQLLRWNEPEVVYAVLELELITLADESFKTIVPLKICLI